MSMVSHGLDLPDPYRPHVMPNRLGQAANQRNRKAEILTATRRRIAELGYRRVTNRMIADDCGLSPQTVYNLVGDRSRLISEAMTSYMKEIGEVALPQLENVHSMFVADAYWQAAAAEPDLLRQVSSSYFEKNFEIGRRIEACSIHMLVQVLSKLRASGRMASGVDLWALAECTTSANAAAYFAWAHDVFDVQELRVRIARAHLFALSSYMVPEETERAHRWLERLIADSGVDSPAGTDGRRHAA